MIIIHVRKWLERLKFIILFLLLTFLISQLLKSAGDWTNPLHKYEQPEGQAVKVFSEYEGAGWENGRFADRLRFFYWYGE